MGGRKAENHLGQFAAARPDQPGHPDDLAFPKLETDILRQRFAVEVLDFQNDFSDRGIQFGIQVVDGATHHQVNQFIFSGFGDGLGGDVAAIAQDRDAISHLKHFLQAVTDIDDPHAALFEQVHDAEQPLHVGFGQGGGGFIHDQNTRIQGQGLRNFNALAIAHGQRADFARHVQVVNIQRGQNFDGFFAHRRPPDRAQARSAARVP